MYYPKSREKIKQKQKYWTHLNNFPNSAGISLSRLSQQMNCTLQKLCCHRGLPGRREVCNYRFQSGGESCLVRANTRRSDHRNPVCSHANLGRNLQNHPVSSETLSNLHRLFSDHRKLQIHPNHQGRFCTLHCPCHQTWKLQRSSCKLKLKMHNVVNLLPPVTFPNAIAAFEMLFSKDI